LPYIHLSLTLIRFKQFGEVGLTVVRHTRQQHALSGRLEDRLSAGVREMLRKRRAEAAEVVKTQTNHGATFGSDGRGILGSYPSEGGGGLGGFSATGPLPRLEEKGEADGENSGGEGIHTEKIPSEAGRSRDVTATSVRDDESRDGESTFGHIKARSKKKAHLPTPPVGLHPLDEAEKYDDPSLRHPKKLEPTKRSKNNAASPGGGGGDPFMDDRW
jgi:hypothetical protein